MGCLHHVALDRGAAVSGDAAVFHDRTAGTTVRVDRPTIAEGAHWSSWPNFSDSAELVYVTTTPDLVPEDTDTADDVFVVNLETLAHTEIVQTHEIGTAWQPVPLISADGRYVVYAGDIGSSMMKTFVVDRLTGTSHTVNPRADGYPDYAGGYPYGPSISAACTAIAFEGTAGILANGIGSRGIFVSTAVALSPTEIEASREFGSYTFDIDVPAGVAWTLNWNYSTGLDSVTPSSGTGPATVDVTVLENNSGGDLEHIITLGSEQVVIRQEIGPQIGWATPSWGPMSGGTEVSISGAGFKDARR